MVKPNELWEKWTKKGRPAITKQQLIKIYEALKRYANKLGIDPETYAKDNLNLVDPSLSFDENIEKLRRLGVNLIFTEEERKINQTIETYKQQLIKRLSDLDPKFREFWKEYTDYQIENVNLRKKVKKLAEQLKKIKTELERIEAESKIKEIEGKISKNEELIKELQKKLEERIEEPHPETLKGFLDEVARRLIEKQIPLSKDWLEYRDFAKKFYQAVKPFDAYKFIPYFIELWDKMIRDPSRAYNIFVEGMNLLLSKLQRPELTRIDAAKLVENWLEGHNIKYPVNISRFLDENWSKFEPILKKGDVETFLEEIDKLLPEFIIKERPGKEKAEREIRTHVSSIIFDRREIRRMLVRVLNEILGIGVRPIEPITPRGTRVVKMIRGDVPPYITHPVAVDKDGYPSLDNLVFIRQLYKNLLEREIWVKEGRPPTEEEKAKMEIWKDLEKNPPSKEEIRRILTEIYERTQSPSIRSWITRLLELMRG
jgi:hypothetical protein